MSSNEFENVDKLLVKVISEISDQVGAVMDSDIILTDKFDQVHSLVFELVSGKETEDKLKEL